MRMLWTTKEIDAPASLLWGFLVTPEVWSRWGPSVRGAHISGERLSAGTTGTVTTAVGVSLPFRVTELQEGSTWSWEVMGIPATSHSVEALGPDRCRVGFGVPWPAAAYLAVCQIALHRLARMAAEQRSRG